MDFNKFKSVDKVNAKDKKEVVKKAVTVKQPISSAIRSTLRSAIVKKELNIDIKTFRLSDYKCVYQFCDTCDTETNHYITDSIKCNCMVCGTVIKVLEYNQQTKVISSMIEQINDLILL